MAKEFDVTHLEWRRALVGYERETASEYRRDFDAQLIAAYEEVRAKGMIDPVLDRKLRIPGQMDSFPAPVALEIAQRFKVMGLRLASEASQVEG